MNDIEIEELKLDNEPKVILYITIHLKLDGYAPKYSIEYLRKINTGEKQKASHSKNDLLFGGGEGGMPVVCTMCDYLGISQFAQNIPNFAYTYIVIFVLSFEYCGMYHIFLYTGIRSATTSCQPDSIPKLSQGISLSLNLSAVSIISSSVSFA